MRIICLSLVLAASLTVGCAERRGRATPTPTSTAQGSQGDQFLATARQAATQGRLVEAEANADLAVAYFKASGPQASRVEALKFAAETATQSKKWDKAIQYYRDLVSLDPTYRNRLDSLVAARHLEAGEKALSLAERALKARNYPEAQALGQEALKEFEACHDRVGVKRAQKILGKAATSANLHLQRTQKMGRQGAEESSNSDDQQQTLHDAAHRAARYHN